MTEVEEIPALDKATQDNYRVWKKNTPFLYDYITTYSLLWPSLSVQFFPDLEKPTPEVDPFSDSKPTENDLLQQRLLLGTYTLGQTVDSISILQLPYYQNLNRNLNIDKLNFNPDKSEFELTTVPRNKISVSQKINHYGDVNRLVYMPQNPDVLASGNNYGNLAVYNRTKHSTYKNVVGDTDDISAPDLTLSSTASLEGNEIFAVDWNKQKEGVIASGKMNGSINIYDIKSQYKESTDIPPLHTIGVSEDGINDLQWVPDHDSIFCTVNEAGVVSLIDTRTKQPVTSEKVANHPINTISVNPHDSMYIALGEAQGTVSVWDLRNIKDTKAYDIDAHTDAVTRVKWHPSYHNVIASSSVDKTVKLYDLSDTESPLFVHSGHMLGVNDFDWSLHDKWMISSVSDDNSLHVWKPSFDIIRDYK